MIVNAWSAPHATLALTLRCDAGVVIGVDGLSVAIDGRRIEAAAVAAHGGWTLALERLEPDALVGVGLPAPLPGAACRLDLQPAP